MIYLDELRELARPYLSNGKTILEIATGDNVGPFWALYPLVHPDGKYVGVDPLYDAQTFKSLAMEQMPSAANSGLIAKPMSPESINLEYTSADAQFAPIPNGIDLVIGFGIMHYLLRYEELGGILRNIARHSPNATVMLFENDNLIQQYCLPYLRHTIELKTRGYCIIGEL